MRGITRRACRNRSRRATFLFGAALAAGSIAIHSTPASASLVLRYNYDEPSGAVTNVANPGTYTGSLVGGIARNSLTPGGGPGSSVLSPGNDGDYVETANNAGLDPLDVSAGSKITMTTWLRLPATPVRFDNIMGNFGFEGALIWYIDRNNSNAGPTASSLAMRMDAKVAPGSGGVVSSGKSANLSADNKWVFVAATYDGSGGGGGLVRFFLGDETTAVAQSGPDTLFAGTPRFDGSSNTLKIAAKQDISNPGNSTNGYFDDTRVYIGDFLDASALDAVRLENLSAGVPEPATGLLVMGAASLVLTRVRRIARK